MKTKEQVLDAIKGGRKSECAPIDSRDYARLAQFFPNDQLYILGLEHRDDGTPREIKDFTIENVLAQLKKDVAFGFEKALNQRGISSSLMYEVVEMWMWVLDDPLQDMEEYAMYGLPLFKAVAVKYGFDNPIGDDLGSEDKYGE